MTIVGLDLSITSTGLAVRDDAGKINTHRIQSTPRATGPLIKTKTGMRASQTYEDKLTRYAIIGHKIGQHIPAHSTVYLEGPSYGSTGSSAHDIAGNWWLTLQMLDEKDCRVTVVPPSTLKIYAAGTGNAGKDEVLSAVVRRYLDIAITGNDVADAVTLMAIGCRIAGAPLEDSLPATHLRALTALRAA